MKRFLLVFSLLLAVPAWAQNPVTVHVVDGQNAPVAGASVQAQLWAENAEPVRFQLTDKNGTVQLDVPTAENGQPAPGSVSVVARGFAFNCAALAGKSLEIRLQPGVTWRGKVVDVDENPSRAPKCGLWARCRITTLAAESTFSARKTWRFIWRSRMRTEVSPLATCPLR